MLVSPNLVTMCKHHFLFKENNFFIYMDSCYIKMAQKINNFFAEPNRSAPISANLQSSIKNPPRKEMTCDMQQ